MEKTMTPESNTDRLNTEVSGRLQRRVGPRGDRGQFVPRECPKCGNGTLQRERINFGNYYLLHEFNWRCDGLLDPEDMNKPLIACDYGSLLH